MANTKRPRAGKAAPASPYAAATPGEQELVTLMEFRENEVGTPLEAFNWVASSANWLNRLGCGGQPACRIGMQRWEEGAKMLCLEIRYSNGYSTPFLIFLGSTIHGDCPQFSSTTAVVPDMLDALHLAGMLVGAIGGVLLQVADVERDSNPAVWSLARGDAILSRVAPANHQRHPHGPELAAREHRQAEYNNGETFTPLEVFNTVAFITQSIRRTLPGEIPHVRLAARDFSGFRGLKVMLACAAQPGADYVTLLFRATGRWCPPRRPSANSWLVDVIALDQALHMVEMIAEALGAETFILGGQPRERNPLLSERWAGGSYWVQHECAQRAAADHQRQQTVHAVAHDF